MKTKATTKNLAASLPLFFLFSYQDRPPSRPSSHAPCVRRTEGNSRDAEKTFFFKLRESLPSTKLALRDDRRSGSTKRSGVRPGPLPALETLPAELFSRFSERVERLKGGWNRQNGKKEREKQ